LKVVELYFMTTMGTLGPALAPDLFFPIILC